MNEPSNTVEEVGLIKLGKDLKALSTGMDRDQAKMMIRAYYSAQEDRMRRGKQSSGAASRYQPHAVLDFFEAQSLFQERQVASAVTCWAESQPMARWAMDHAVGVGPILAAGLVAFIDITKAPTVGHIWRFAGLDPTSKWSEGKKRPWCAALKTTCWKIWQSWLKLKHNPNAFYAHQFSARRKLEWDRNLSGELAGQATQQLGCKNWDRKGPAYQWLTGKVDREWARNRLESGEQFPEQPVLAPEGTEPFPMLPPGHIQSRAGRWAVKLFLAHWHAEAYRQHYNAEPPFPYPIAILGHAHQVPAPAARQRK